VSEGAAETPLPTPQDVKYVCPGCGSESIVWDGSASWDIVTQDDVLAGVWDGRATCDDCGEESWPNRTPVTSLEDKMKIAAGRADLRVRDAAPALLEALKVARHYVDDAEDRAAVEAAIAQAEGELP
jgi:hypothetical protein